MGTWTSTVWLIGGLLFPVVSWCTFALVVWSALRRSPRAVSGVYIPFVGPVVLSVWIAGSTLPRWSMALVWVLDIGTVFFLIALPGLIRQERRHSKATRLFSLAGSVGLESVRISFHKGGHYLLEKRSGTMRLAECGTFSATDPALALQRGGGRMLRVTPDAMHYVVTDEGPGDTLGLQGWQLTREA